MKKITRYLLTTLLLTLTFCTVTKAQDLKYCGSTEAEQELIKRNPDILRIQEALEKYTRENQSNVARTAGTVYTIPVVFHIVHQYGSENISDAQVYDAVRVLNEDFRKLNADTSDVVQSFKSIVADSEIQFKLAQKDPNGNCTNGIDRIYSKETLIGDNNCKLNPWPRKQYLNIWVVKEIDSGAAGYAYKPGSVDTNPLIDGIVILSTYVGSIGTGYYGTARALTHEVGHWLNLDHTWGGTNSPGVNCLGNDDVADTPETIGWTTCNLSGSSCGSALDNVQNYMEYAYCQRMFTQGQAIRMRTALTSTIAERNNLWASTNLVATGTSGTNSLCVVDFKVKEFGCLNSSLKFSDLSYNVPLTWAWSFPGSTTPTSDVQNPTVTYDTPGLYDVTLTVTNESGSKTTQKPGYITIYPDTAQREAKAFSETFENITLPSSEWSITSPTEGGNRWLKTTNVGYSGTSSATLSNSSTAKGQIDELITPSFDMTTLPADPKLTFKVAYAQRTNSSNDKLQVLTSIDCGSTWSTRFTKSGFGLATAPVNSGNFVPSGLSQWREETISVLSFVSYDKVWFKFVFTSDGGNNIYIDDVNISPAVGIDDKISSFLNLSLYPNPASKQAEVSFTLAARAEVKLQLMDMLGREVENVTQGRLEAGEYKYNVGSVPGIYMVKLTIGKQSFVKRLVIN